jgi:hypothetical protein
VGRGIRHHARRAIALVSTLAVLALIAYVVPRVAPRTGANVSTWAAGPPGVPIGYGPSWLPAGFEEESRRVYPPQSAEKRAWDYRVDRTWSSPASRQTDADTLYGLRVEVFRYRKPPACFSGNFTDNVDVNGNPAIYDRLAHDVCFVPDPLTLVKVDGDESMDEADLLRIARSVRPVAGHVIMPVWTGKSHLPELFLIDLHGNPDGRWQCSLRFESEFGNARTYRIELGTAIWPPAGGAAVRVRGRSGRHIATVEHIPARGPNTDVGSDKPVTKYEDHLVVDLGYARWLTVTYTGFDMEPPPVATLLQIADEIGVRAVDLSWLGSHP